MTRAWEVLWVLLGMAVCAVPVFVWPNAMLSPGALRAGHRQLAGDCLKCHSPFRGAPADRCLSCHPVDQIGLAGAGDGTGPRKAKTPFHKHLIEEDCNACHVEHGDVAVGRTEITFDHESLWTTAQNACALCHPMPQDMAHRGLVRNCEKCHGTAQWSPATCDHRKYFRLDRDHRAECVTCHPGGDLKKYTCYGCHEHSPNGMRREHREERVTDLDKCAECHGRRGGDGRGRGHD